MPDLMPTAFRAAAGAARVAPKPVVAGAGWLIGRGAAQAARTKRRVVERNLQRVTGRRMGAVELRRAVQRTFDSYARYYVDSFRLPGLSPEEVDAGFSYEGYGHVEAALASGRGPILALPHLGGWEWAAFWLTEIQGVGVTAVVEELDPPELFEWFLEFRRRLGINVVPVGPTAAREVSAAVKRGDVVCLLADRDLGGDGPEVEFFGERTTLPGGPALLALRNRTVLLPAACYFRGPLVHGVVRPPVPTERRGELRDDVARITQLLAGELELLIRAEPEQWHLMQPNWPSDHEALGTERAGA